MSVIKIRQEKILKSINDWRDPLYLNNLLTDEEKSIHSKAKDFCRNYLMPSVIENNDKISRVKLPSYDSSIFKTTGGCDFPLDALGKFVSATLPSVVTNFVEKFKIKPWFKKHTNWEFM